MKTCLSALLMAGMLWSFSGCGGSSSSDNSGGQQVVIDSAQKAKNSFAVLGYAVEMLDISNEVGDFRKLVQFERPRAWVNRYEGNRTCDVSGSIDYKFQFDDQNQDSQRVLLDFHNCRLTGNDETWNGAITYAFSGQNSSREMNVTYADFMLQDGNNLLTLNTTAQLKIKSETEAESTFNGTVVRAYNGMENRLTLENFVIDVQELANQDASISVDGKLSLSSTPASCADGNYTVETVERVVVVHEEDKPVSGKVKVNSIVYKFNQDGTVTATVNGEEVTFDQELEDFNCLVVTQ